MEVSDFVKWSMGHVLQVSKCCSDKEEWNLLEWSVGFPWYQVQETEPLNCPEEEDQRGIKEGQKICVSEIRGCRRIQEERDRKGSENCKTIRRRPTTYLQIES